MLCHTGTVQTADTACHTLLLGRTAMVHIRRRLSVFKRPYHVSEPASKIHRVAVTQCELHYDVAPRAIDEDWLPIANLSVKRAGAHPGTFTNGERFRLTYAIKGERRQRHDLPSTARRPGAPGNGDLFSLARLPR